MKYNLTVGQIEMLLKGESLYAGNTKIRLPEGFEDRKSLEAYVRVKPIQRIYVVQYNTESSALSIIKRRSEQ